MENKWLPGRLYLSCEQPRIMDALQCGMYVIAVIDVAEERDPQYQGCCVMSSLLPPSSSITEMINGNLQKGIQLYYQYLLAPERETTITHILAALHQKPRNFLLYTEYDSNKEFHILETLGHFFFTTFGIGCGVFMNPQYPAFNVSHPQYDYAISNLLFSNGFINSRTYACMMPPNTIPTEKSCIRLSQTIPIRFQTKEEAMRYCIGLIANLREEEMTKKISPIVFIDRSREIVNETGIQPYINYDQRRR